jgi:uncharacterized membrane protein YgcG
MRPAMHRRRLTIVAVLSGMLALAPAAGASITPTLSLNQSAGKTAGASHNLGLDLKFSDTGTDSPRDLSLNLPPGLLANASVDGGACLKQANVSGSACQIGSGTVSATADPLGLLNVPVPVSVPVAFYLVPPPAAGDLAGLAVEGLGEQIGATGEIKVRPTGSPDGVGVTLNLRLPDQLPLTLPIIGKINAAQISLTEINSTFDGLRYPATCPATPANLSASADSYGDATVHTVTAPLPVTGCASLAYAPAFTVSAARDSADRQVKLSTTITQTAAQAPSRSESLAFPTSVLAPNLASIKALCLNLASGTCPTVGSASATSPLYPKPLTGQAYLTGSSSGLSLTLVFPSPFPLTLTGAVDLVKNSATFTGLPDIPLTNLQVSLNGGANGLFLSTCQTPTGTATATLTDQSGDKSVTVPSRFTVSGCPAGGAGQSTGSGAGTGSPAGAGGGSSANGGSGSSAGGGSAGSANQPSVSAVRSGLRWLSFRITVARHAAKLDALTIELPAGLSFIGHRAGGRLTVAGVTVAGAGIRSLSLSHGHLVITLRRPVSSLTVKIRTTALRQSAALEAKQLKRLRLTVITETTKARRSRLHVTVAAPPAS